MGDLTKGIKEAIKSSKERGWNLSEENNLFRKTQIKSCKCGGQGFIDWWQNPRQSMETQAFVRCDTCQTAGPKVSLTNSEALITNMDFEKYQKAVELWNDCN